MRTAEWYLETRCDPLCQWEGVESGLNEAHCNTVRFLLMRFIVALLVNGTMHRICPESVYVTNLLLVVRR